MARTAPWGTAFLVGWLVALASLASAQTTTTTSTLPSGGAPSVLKFSGIGDSQTRAPIQAICWVGCTTAGTAVIQDGASGGDLWAGSCPLTNTTFCFVPSEPVWVKATIRVTTLSSGTLYVYLSNR